jgi:hypothetical protein
MNSDTKLKGDVAERDLFHVFPSEVFIGYGSEVHLVEADKRQRKPRSAAYREAWELILQWAARGETHVRSPVKVGEAAGGVIPSQAPSAVAAGEGVET